MTQFNKQTLRQDLKLKEKDEVLVFKPESKEIYRMPIDNFKTGLNLKNSFEVSLQEITDLISQNKLIPFYWYKILNVDSQLYGGTTIYLQAITTNRLALEGYGEFYNPRYDSSITGMGIWDSNGTYGVGDKVIWGGYSWTNLNGNVGTSTDVLNLEEEEWSKDPYDEIIYNKVIDKIEYDIFNNHIQMRHSYLEQKTVVFPFLVSNLFSNAFSYSFNSIAVMQWGVGIDLVNFKGSGSTYVYESVFECVNNKGLIAQGTISKLSKVSNCILEGFLQQFNIENTSTIEGLNLLNNTSLINFKVLDESQIANVTFDTSETIDNLVLQQGSQIENLTIEGEARISNCVFSSFNCDFDNYTYSLITNKFNNSVFKGLNTSPVVMPDLNAATHIFEDKIKEIYSRPDNALKIKFMNNLDLLQVVNIVD